MRINPFSLFLIILIVAMVTDAFTFPRRSEIYPITVGTIALFFLFVDLVSELVKRKKVEREEKAFASGKVFVEEEKPVSSREEIKAVGWTFLIIMLMPFLLGFQIGLPAAIVLFLKFYGKYSWKKSIFYGILAGGIVYLFAFGFQIVFPRGLFEYLS